VARRVTAAGGSALALWVLRGQIRIAAQGANAAETVMRSKRHNGHFLKSRWGLFCRII